MNLKSQSVSAIQYILIKSELDTNILFSQPYSEGNNIFDELRSYPADFLQIYHAFTFFENDIRFQLNQGMNLLIFPDFTINEKQNPILEYTSLLNLKNKIVVYFIDGNSKYLSEIFKSIEICNQNNWYYKFYNEKKLKPKIVHKKRYFKSVFGLIHLFRRDLKKD